jgi:hypothetical protein
MREDSRNDHKSTRTRRSEPEAHERRRDHDRLQRLDALVGDPENPRIWRGID